MYQLKKIVLRCKMGAENLFVCSVEEGMYDLTPDPNKATNFKTVNKAVTWMRKYAFYFEVAKALLPLTPKWEVKEL